MTRSTRRPAHEDHHSRRRHRRRHRRMLHPLPPDAGGLDRRHAAGTGRADVGHHLAFSGTGDEFRHVPDDGRPEKPLDRAVQGIVGGPGVSRHLPPRRRRHPAGQHAGTNGWLSPLCVDGAWHGGAFRGHRRRRMRPPPPVDFHRHPCRRALGPVGWRHRPGAAVPGAGPPRAPCRGRSPSPDPRHRAAPVARRQLDRHHAPGRNPHAGCHQRLRLSGERSRRHDGGASPGHVHGTSVFRDRGDPADRAGRSQDASAALPDLGLLLQAGQDRPADRLLRTGLPDLGHGRDRPEVHQRALPRRPRPDHGRAGGRLCPVQLAN